MAWIWTQDKTEMVDVVASSYPSPPPKPLGFN
jgi:hypothetical protein